MDSEGNIVDNEPEYIENEKDESFIVGDEDEENAHQHMETSSEELENDSEINEGLEEEAQKKQENIEDDQVFDEANEIVENDTGPNMDPNHGVDTDDIVISVEKLGDMAKVTEGIFAGLKRDLGEIPIDPLEENWKENSEKINKLYNGIGNSASNLHKNGDKLVKDIQYIVGTTENLKNDDKDVFEFFDGGDTKEEIEKVASENPDKAKLLEDEELFNNNKNELHGLAVELEHEFDSIEESFKKKEEVLEENGGTAEENKEEIVEKVVGDMQPKLRLIVQKSFEMNEKIHELENIKDDFNKVYSESEEDAETYEDGIKRRHKLI